MLLRSLASTLSVLALTLAPAAFAAKRPLNFKDFDSWRALNGQVISRDGRFLAYGLFPQEGDGEVVVRDVTTGKELRENAGQLPAPAPPDPNSEAPPRPRAIRLAFTPDSHYLIFVSYAKKADTKAAPLVLPASVPAAAETARLAGRAAARADLPSGDLVIFNLTSSTPTRVPRVKDFGIPDQGESIVAYSKAPATRATPGKPALGTDLVIRSLDSASERTLPDVLEYVMTKDGRTVSYAVASSKDDTNGVYVIPTKGSDAPKSLLTGKGQYKKLTWDDKQDELAFVSSHDDAASKQAKYKLYLWDRKAAQAAAVASVETQGFRAGFVIADTAALAFSKDGTRLFFGAAPPPLPEHKTGTPADDEAAFDLWHYKDDHIQPMQKVRAGQERTRSYRAVYIVPQHKLVQLADAEMTELTPSENGRFALGSDDREYRPAVEFGERAADSFLVDTETGKRTLLAKKHSGTTTWSPDGKYAIAFDGENWNSTAVPSAKTVNLTAKLPVKFWTEDNDTSGMPRPYGLAGWSKDGKSVLLYDRFDIWELSPDGSHSTNYTAGMGRKNNLELRYVKLDPEEKVIDTAKPLLMRAENVLTRETGFYSGATQLAMGAVDYGMPMKAKNADVFVVAAQKFDRFPDLLVTDASMKDLKKVTDANPQKSDLLWGTAEMVSFKNLDGVSLQGALYKPENFDPAKKYPMIVYIYEKLSQNLNHFTDPKPMDSINIPYYVSNGYLVFTPDIVYTIGYPGQSALKCVLGGVDAMVNRGFVDEANIGIQGHSWGGYQIAYMITQTSRFKAVEAGAVVANMTSAYNGIRWGTGLPRQFQYEKTQSRIGGSLWEYPLRFLENSPLFQADRVKTPILMVHNDADDAVPWYQGIEYYLALRRLNKEVYMFSYAGEPHHLQRRANQKDYARRLAQYFDYELKGAAKPAWMEKGIPYLHAAEEPATDIQ